MLAIVVAAAPCPLVVALQADHGAIAYRQVEMDGEKPSQVPICSLASTELDIPNLCTAFRRAPISGQDGGPVAIILCCVTKNQQWCIQEGCMATILQPTLLRPRVVPRWFVAFRNIYMGSGTEY